MIKMVFSLKGHIKYRAKQWKRDVPKDWRKILKRYKSIKGTEGNAILCNWWMAAWPTVLNATSMFPGAIVCNAEWGARIVLYDNEETMNAFRITIGHELTHKDNEFSSNGYKGIDKLFIKRVNEMRADFGAAKRMAKSNRLTLLASCRYKLNHKLQNGLPDEEKDEHPTWKKRIDCIEHNDFNEKLIREIADDIHYTNTDMIDLVVDFYKGREIKLIPEPKQKDDTN